MMPCAHRKVDVSEHRTIPKPGTQIRVVEGEAALAFLSGVAASEKRDPKSTNKWQSHDDCCPSKSMYILIVRDYNKLLLQQLAVTAGCCCGMLLYCGDESASPNKWGTVYAHMVLYPPSSPAAWKTLTTSHNTQHAPMNRVD